MDDIKSDENQHTFIIYRLQSCPQLSDVLELELDRLHWDGHNIIVLTSPLPLSLLSGIALYNNNVSVTFGNHISLLCFPLLLLLFAQR